MGQVSDPTQQKAMGAITKYGPPFFFLIMAFQTASVQILFLVGSLYSLFQTVLFRSPTFRSLTGLYPLSGKPAASSGKKTLNTYVNPQEAASSQTVKARWQRFRGRIQETTDKYTKGKSTPARLSKTDLDRAKQYEKDRRAEIEAAREAYLKRQQRR